MKKLIFITLTLVIFASVPACKTTHTITTENARDTLVITRDSFVYRTTHDTITITRDKDRDVIRVLYDTAQRVREVVKIQYRDRYKEAQGTAQTQIIHDTIRVNAGSSVAVKTEKQQEKNNPFKWFIAGGIIAAVVIIFRKTIVNTFKHLHSLWKL